MNRRGNTHRGGWPRAWRLILAHLHDDQHAHQLIHTELGDCPGCWRDVALAATEFAALSIYGEAGGSTTRASAYIEGQIACALDAEALDKIDAPITPDTIAEAIRRQAETRRTAAAPRPVTNQDVRQHRRRERKPIMTYTPTWPTCEEWGRRYRGEAESLIETGISGHELGDPEFTEAERAEVEALAPEAVKTVRRACGRIERTLRREHPDAVIQPPGGVTGVEAWDYHRAAYDALPDADRDAHDDLDRLRDVRRRVSQMLHWPSPFQAMRFTDHWPQRYERPVSPELDRLNAICEQAVARHAAKNRDIGRRMLADLESGVAWEKHLEHRAFCEEYFRTGPVTHRTKV